MTKRIQNSQTLLAIGFALVLALMATLVVLGLGHARALNARMAVIVNQYNAKTDLVAFMRHVARERSIALHRMALMSDPFDRDAEYLKFRQAAWSFIEARSRLLQLPLSSQERRVLERSQKLTEAAVRFQEAVYELITEERFAEANALLVSEAVPAQDRVFAEFDRMMEMQKAATAEAVASAERDYREAVRALITLGVLALALGAVIAVFVTRRSVESERALFREKERAEVTLHSIADGVITTTPQGRIEYMNPVAEALTGWALEAAHGRPLSEVLHVVNEVTREDIASPVTDGVLEGQVVSADPNGVLLARDGREYAIEQSAAPMRDQTGTLTGAVVVFRDVSPSRHLARELSWQATHDALTGLGNRSQFETVVERLLESARSQGKHHALIYMDLDQFKLVNDTCGHAAGDELLRQLSLMLLARVREGDSLFRLGGDEFAVLLSGCPIDRAVVIANELRQTVEEFRFGWEGKTFAVGASLGLVPITPESGHRGQVLAAADAACYAAKEKGRNRVQVYEPGDSELALREGEMQWLLRLNRALEEGRLVLYYQKMVGTREPHGVVYEILLRLRDEDGSIVPPQAFIPAAERYQLMPSIDRWVVRHALAWAAANPERLASIEGLFINLSGQSLNDEKFLGFAVEQMSEHGTLAEKIGFEITETAAIANLSRATRFIATMKGMGCRFALDDFGSGMSSFAYLKSLGVDKVKIDGVFVRDMLNDNVDYAMVEAINRIGQLMGIETVAEFVESWRIREAVRALGVDYAQGYAIHRPEPLFEAGADADGVQTTHARQPV